jgi:phosphoenolpyruvate carboxylase
MNSKIIETLTRIETKLDEVIAALHAYDGDEWDEPNDALKEAAAQYNERIHHVTNEEADEDAKFDDYGMRVVGDRDGNNNPAKHTVGDKKRNKRKYYKPKNKG